MIPDIQTSKKDIHYYRNSYRLKKIPLILALLTGSLLFPLHQAKSKEIFLKCTGKFELNRGELIKPDWETSYLTINMDGIISTINDGVKKTGRTLIRRNSYIITIRDNNKRIESKYMINEKHGTYTVYYPQINRTLIGTCQKGRG